MRKSILMGFLAVFVLFTACKKDEDESCPLTDQIITVPASEITDLETYLSSKGITNAVKDSRGFYYTIQNPGTGITPSLCNFITVYYAGKLTNDVIFDQTTSGSPISFGLGGNLIEGWKKGIPLIKQGGRITLYLPPSLGYGNQSVGNGKIPANSILIFDVELLEVR
jgi:FKBP-type peptidyl-prolyl cis-trans isomerase FkpA